MFSPAEYSQHDARTSSTHNLYAAARMRARSKELESLHRRVVSMRIVLEEDAVALMDIDIDIKN